MAPARALKTGTAGEPPRPDPRKLLAKLQVEEQRVLHSRAVLRVYLGAAPGVGKTFAMLNEGQRRHARGTDVVIGFVETYNRPLTVQAAQGLEAVPRRSVSYRGTSLEEMDTDAVIARHPTVALVDELAHTNAPGSKHDKRWQDVQDILDAGITVITTVNIQHLESLRDRVEQITGIKVQETVPDRVVDQADDVELIDMAPEALRARMRHGNIYPPERAQQELNGLFQPEKLAALRELALRRTAEEVDDQLAAYMREHNLSGWQVDERVLVCIDHRPLSEAVLHRACALARGLKCQLTAVHVQVSGLSAADKSALKEHLQEAESLGAELEQLEGGDVAETIARFAVEKRITQVFVGHPERSRWHELLHGSLVRDLLRRLPDVDVRIIGDHRADADCR